MTKVVVAYHSGFGHTKAIAESILKGVARVEGIEPTLVNVDDLGAPDQEFKLGPEWDVLHQADGIIMGSPTYMGTVSAGFKRFMDSCGAIWLTQAWRDKVAAGFTNGGALSGDKLNTLTSLSIFASQLSMIWISQGVHMDSENGLNRMGSYHGFMAQSEEAAPDQTPPKEDHATAELFGERVARATLQWVTGRPS